MTETKEVFYARGIECYDQANIQQSISYLIKAIEIAFNEIPVEPLFIFEKSTELAQMMIESNATNDAISYIHVAYETFQSHSSVLKVYEESGDILELLGNQAFYFELLDLAAACYSGAEKLYHGYDTKCIVKAKLFLVSGHQEYFSDAIAGLKTILIKEHNLKPVTKEKILKYYGDVLSLAGFYEKALEIYQQIIQTKELKSENSASWIFDMKFNIGVLFYELGKYQEALHIFDEMLHIFNNNYILGSLRLKFDVQLHIIKINGLLGNAEEAKRVLCSIEEDDLYLKDRIRYQLACANVQLLSPEDDTFFDRDYLGIVSEYQIKAISGIDDIAILTIQSMNHLRNGNFNISMEINQKIIDYYLSINHIPELINYKISDCKIKISSRDYNISEIKSLLNEIVILNKDFSDTAFGFLRSIEVAELLLKIDDHHNASLILQDISNNDWFIFRNYILSNEVQRTYYHDKLELLLNIAYNIISRNKKEDQSHLFEFFANLHIKLKGFSVISNQLFRSYLNNCKPKEADLISNYNNYLKKLDVCLNNKSDNYRLLKEKANILENRIKTETNYIDSALGLVNIKWGDIKARLEINEAAISFCRYEHSDNPMNDNSGYMVFIFFKESSQPLYFDLNLNDNQVRDLLPFFTIREHGKKFPISTNVGKFIIQNLKELYIKLIEPIEHILNDKQYIYFTVDGLLNYIPFGALLDTNGKYLMEKNELFQLQNLRDIKSAGKQKKIDSISIFGGIDYGYHDNGDSGDNENHGENRPLSEIREIREAVYETVEICELFQKKSLKGQVLNTLDLRTLENEIKLKTPACIHITTHGFFFNDESRQYDLHEPESYKTTDIQIHSHPLVRSGLFASNFNRFTGNSGDSPYEQGVITSFDISQLNLENTLLITLHACETALGAVRSGEAFGLCRAFKLAGVKYIILTLWEIRFTKFYIYFYRYLTESGCNDIRDAFQKAINDVRQESPNPYWWSGFVLIE